MIPVLEWLIWGFGASLAVGFVLIMRKEARRGAPILIGMIMQTALMFCCAALFVIEPWSKFHLLWILPGCFLVSFLGLPLLTIPLLGTILRVVLLAFARLFLIGVGGNVIGVPGGK